MLLQTIVNGSTASSIATSVESAVSCGQVPPGTPMPTVRRAAQELGVSVSTVAAAYRLLRDRGILHTDGRRGSRLRQGAPVGGAARILPIPKGVRDLASGNPDPEFLPLLEVRSKRPRLYNEDLNDPELIELAKTMFMADSIPAENVGVVSGGLDGMERVLREHLRAGDRVAVEDPCFTGIADILAALGLSPLPVELDAEGMKPESLRGALDRDAKAVILMPRAQNPTGAYFTSRRQRLLRDVLSADPQVLVIEDDHAGPIADVPHLTLVDAERPRWAVVRSLSKSLGPDLRLALLAADAQTLARVEGRQNVGIRWVSHLLQNLAVNLLRDAKIARLVRRASSAYKKRREALLSELHRRRIPAIGASGLNVWIPVAEESIVVQAMQQRGWGVRPAEPYRIKSGPAIRITTAALEPADAVRVAEDLSQILGSRMRGSAS